MPDYFVPLDTTNRSNYLNRLFANNSVQEFTFKYVAANKDELEDKGYESYRRQFQVSDEMLNELVRIGKTNGIEPDMADLRRNKELFQLQIKAQIARQIWDYQGFYPIYNQTNEVLQKAIKLFDQAEKLDRTKM